FGGRIDMGAVESQPNPLPGDYNFDGVVDAADYTVWADTKGSTTDLRADGTASGVVDQADYDFWKAHFGMTSGAAAAVEAVGSGGSGVGSVVVGQKAEREGGSEESRIANFGLRIDAGERGVAALSPRPALAALGAPRVVRDDALLVWLTEQVRPA